MKQGHLNLLCWIFQQSLRCFFCFSLGLHHRFHRLAYLHWPVHWPNVLTPPTLRISSSQPNPTPPSIILHFPSTNSFQFTPLLSVLPPSCLLWSLSMLFVFPYTTHLLLIYALLSFVSLCPSYFVFSQFLNLFFMSDTFFSFRFLQRWLLGIMKPEEKGIIGKERIGHLTKTPHGIQTQDLEINFLTI